MYPELVKNYNSLRRLFLISLIAIRYVLSALSTHLSLRKRRTYQWFFRVQELRTQLQGLSREKQPVRYGLTRWRFIHARYSLAAAYRLANNERMLHMKTIWWVKYLLLPILWPVFVAILLFTLLLLNLPLLGLFWLLQYRAGRKLAKARRAHLMSLARAALVLFLFGVAEELAKIDRSQVSTLVVLLLTGFLVCCQPKAKPAPPVVTPLQTVDSARIKLQNQANASRSDADRAADAANSTVTTYETDAKTYDALRNPLP